MAEPRAERGRSRLAVMKVLYLFGVTAAVFAAPAIATTRQVQWYIVPGLLAIQVFTLFICGVGPLEILGAVRRLKWLFAFLILCYTLLPSEGRSFDEVVYPWQLPDTPWTIPLNLAGLAQAGLMCLQILTVVLASAVVRLTGSGTDLVDGLRAFGLPRLFVHSLDQTLGLLGDLRRCGGRGSETVSPQDAPAPSPGFLVILRRLLKGDIGFFIQSIQANLDRAREQVSRNTQGRLDARLAQDVAVLTGVALVMVSLKMVKLLPGVPFAPGFKTVLFFPLYILAAHLTWSRWGGTAAGSIMGVIGFLMGDGRYGMLEIIKHLAPGLVIDVLMPVVRQLPQSALVFCLLGFVAAIARTSTEMAVVLLLGARAEVYLFPAAKLVPNLIAGTLSGFVTVVVLRSIRPQVPIPSPGVPTEAASAPTDMVTANDGTIQQHGIQAVQSPMPELNRTD